MSASADKWLAENLYLTAESDRQIYERMSRPICLNMAKKKVTGTYSADLAIKAFERPILAAVQILQRVTEEPVRPNPATRRLAAKHLRDSYMELINEMAAEMAGLKTAKKPWTLRR
jgi:hypothetical protein